MIRQHSLVKNGSGNGIRIRIVACRKRMRVLRAIHKGQIDLQMRREGELSTLEALVAASAETPALLEESALVLPSLDGQDAQLT